jgi:hypothetical protein
MNKSTRDGGLRVIAPLRTEQADSIDMHVGWVQNSPHGFMGVDGSQGGRLVRLLDVVAWLQGALNLPPLAACRALCGDLDSQAFQSLYLVNPGDYAERLAIDCTFEEAVPRSFWESGDEAPPAQGLDGLKSALLKDCVASGANAKHHTEKVAILATKAQSIWGYGKQTAALGEVRATPAAPSVDEHQGAAAPLPEHVRDFEDLLRVRAAAPGAKWQPDMLRALMKEEKARQNRPGAKGVRAALAKELGLKSVQRVGQLIAAAVALPAEPPSLRPGASVFNAA